MEAVVAIIGALIGLFIFKSFGQKRVEAGQKELLAQVEKNRIKDEVLKEAERNSSANEQQKVKEITDEQNKDVTVDNLVDFFNNRKK